MGGAIKNHRLLLLTRTHTSYTINTYFFREPSPTGCVACCNLQAIQQFSLLLRSQASLPLSCSADLICWLMTLFSIDTGSLHALQNSLPQFLHRCSPGNPLTRSDEDTFEGSLEAPFPFFIPFGGLLEIFPFLDRSDGARLLSLLRMLATSVDDSSVSIELLAAASLRSELGSTGPVTMGSSTALYLESSPRAHVV